MLTTTLTTGCNAACEALNLPAGCFDGFLDSLNAGDTGGNGNANDSGFGNTNDNDNTNGSGNDNNNING